MATHQKVSPHRIQLDQKVYVKSRTIGSSTYYGLESGNVSRSGLLLFWGGKVRAPFREKTILDLTIDSQSTLLKHPIECLGQVVRLCCKSDGSCQMGYGVKIIQIATKDWQLWDHTIENLEVQLDEERN